MALPEAAVSALVGAGVVGLLCLPGIGGRQTACLSHAPLTLQTQ